MEESKRLRKLKDELIKKLPFFPNDKKTLLELEGQSLNGVMIHYLHWQTRQVPARPRRIQLAPEVTSDKRWKSLKDDINDLFEKVRNGEDLSPHLSKRAHKKGYTPVQRIRDGEVDSWEDKDQILNTKGFHHFHLDMHIQDSGLAKRTDNVLFAKVSREEFHAIGLFDHSVFDSVDDSGVMNSERTRMWNIYEKYTTLGMEPGTVYISNPIMSSGHPMYLIRMSDYYVRIIEDIDLKLDERNYVNSLYDQANLPHPKKNKLNWHVEGLDLGLLDKKNGVFFNINQGPL